MESEVDVSLMDEESQKIDYEKEDADEDWDDDYEEDDTWNDLDDEKIGQRFVNFAINDNPNDLDWVLLRWQKVGSRKMGEFILTNCSSCGTHLDFSMPQYL